jgi:REP element-mobilizing transposase RayT
MSGIFKGQDSPAIIINGVPDHVHILFILSKNKVLAKIVEEVKKQSSKWTKEQDFGPRKFAWQAGYADFSVSASKVEVVKNYILKQKEHHKRISFQDELRKFLEEYNIEYNEKYLWD